jgi:hypothetical protein
MGHRWLRTLRADSAARRCGFKELGKVLVPPAGRPTPAEQTGANGCAVTKAALSSGCETHPAALSLRPVAIGAAVWKRSMWELLRHRQPIGPATDKPSASFARQPSPLASHATPSRPHDQPDKQYKYIRRASAGAALGSQPTPTLSHPSSVIFGPTPGADSVPRGASDRWRNSTRNGWTRTDDCAGLCCSWIPSVCLGFARPFGAESADFAKLLM